MDRNNIVTEVFKYFARFPDRKGVLANFVTGKDSSELKNYCSNLPATDIIPGLSDYVFGVNEENVEKRIKTIKGSYLFIDYGNFTTTRDNRMVKTDEFHLGITVSQPLNISSLDPVGEVLLTDKLLNILRIIRTHLINDKSDPFVKQIIFPSEITPWYSRELSNSTGWTMLCKLSGIDLL